MLTRIDLAGSVRLRFGLVLRVSNCLGGTVLGALQRKSHPAGPIVAEVEGWCALLAVLACLSEVWCGVGVTQIQFKIA